MADAKGRPIIRPKEVEEERLRKRREYLLGMRDPDPEENIVRPQRGRRSASRSPERERRHHSSRSRRRSRSRSRSNSRDRSRRHRDRSRDRERRRSRDRGHSQDRSRRRRSSSRDRSGSRRQRSRRSASDSEEEFGGYVPRKNEVKYTITSAVQNSPAVAAKSQSGKPATHKDPFYYHKPTASTAVAAPAAAGDATATAGNAAATMDPALAAIIAMQRQQQEAQAEMLRQRNLQAQAIQEQAAAAAAHARTKKQREVYVGNLTPGLTSVEMLKQVFDSAIGAAYQEAAAAATPVVNINMHTEGKYAFVELATEEFAAAAMQLDKLDLCGRALNVARPSGYVDPATQTAQQAAMAAAAAMGLTASARMAPPMPPPDVVLVLRKMLSAEMLRDPQEIADTKEDLEQECGQFGKVLGVHVQTSGADAGDAFVHFKDTTEAAAAYGKFNGRKFDGNLIAAAFTTVDNFATLVALAASAAAAAPAPAPAPVDDAAAAAAAAAVAVVEP